MGKKGVHAHRWLTAGAVKFCRLCGTVDGEQVFSYVSRAVGSGGGVQLSLCLCFVVSMQNLESSTRKLRPYRRRRITLGQGRAHMLPSRKTQAAHGTQRQMRQDRIAYPTLSGGVIEWRRTITTSRSIARLVAASAAFHAFVIETLVC